MANVWWAIENDAYNYTFEGFNSPAGRAQLELLLNENLSDGLRWSYLSQDLVFKLYGNTTKYYQFYAFLGNNFPEGTQIDILGADDGNFTTNLFQMLNSPVDTETNNTIICTKPFFLTASKNLRFTIRFPHYPVENVYIGRLFLGVGTIFWHSPEWDFYDQRKSQSTFAITSGGATTTNSNRYIRTLKLSFKGVSKDKLVNIKNFLFKTKSYSHPFCLDLEGSAYYGRIGDDLKISRVPVLNKNFEIPFQHDIKEYYDIDFPEIKLEEVDIITQTDKTYNFWRLYFISDWVYNQPVSVRNVTFHAGTNVNTNIISPYDPINNMDSWVEKSNDLIGNVICSIYAENTFFIITTNKLMFSKDKGDTWSVDPIIRSGYTFQTLTYGDNKLIIFCNNLNRIMISLDKGLTLIDYSMEAAFNKSWIKCIYGDGCFVAICSDLIITSVDGFLWTNRGNPTNNNTIVDIIYGDGIFILLAEQGQIMTSDTFGSTWTTVAGPATSDNSFICLGYQDNKLLVKSDNHIFLCSYFNFSSWHIFQNNYNFNAILYGRNKFICYKKGFNNNTGNFWSYSATNPSQDEHWKTENYWNTSQLTAASYGQGTIIFFGNGGTAQFICSLDSEIDNAYISSNGCCYDQVKSTTWDSYWTGTYDENFGSIGQWIGINCTNTSPVNVRAVKLNLEFNSEMILKVLLQRGNNINFWETVAERAILLDNPYYTNNQISSPISIISGYNRVFSDAKFSKKHRRLFLSSATQPQGNVTYYNIMSTYNLKTWIDWDSEGMLINSLAINDDDGYAIGVGHEPLGSNLTFMRATGPVTWDKLSSNINFTGHLYKIIFIGNKNYLACGDQNVFALLSDNGNIITIYQPNILSNSRWIDITYSESAGLAVAIGLESPNFTKRVIAYAYANQDFATWTQVTSEAIRLANHGTPRIYKLANQQKFIAFNATNKYTKYDKNIYTYCESTDGIDWITLPLNLPMNDFIYVKELDEYFMVSNVRDKKTQSNYLYDSSDGLNWTRSSRAEGMLSMETISTYDDKRLLLIGGTSSATAPISSIDSIRKVETTINLENLQ